MGKQGPDSEAAPDKEHMRSYWAARGEAWERWAEVVAENAVRLNEPLIAAARLAPGLHVLDLASGAGEPALTIAERVGPEGAVVASDLVPEMLAGAQKRAAARGLRNMRFEHADMEALPFPTASFDRVTCRFGIMFVPHTEKALSEVRRVLKRGGRAAFMVWGPRENTTMFRVIAAAAERVLDPDPALDLSTPFRFAAPGSLAASMVRAGFDAVAEEDIRLEARIPLGTVFWKPMIEMTAGSRLASATAVERDALEAEVAAGFAREVEGDRYALRAHARIIMGDAGDT